MGTKALDWAIDDAPVTDKLEKLLLVIMANYARQDGTGVWLSQSSLAARACCSVRTVGTYLAQMEADGLIRRGDPGVVPRKVPANRRPIVWDLVLSNRRADSWPDDDAESVDNSVDNVTGKPCRSAESDDQARKIRRSDLQPVADKPKDNPRDKPNRSTSSRDEQLLASLRAEVPTPAPECPHGLKPWKCGQCS